ncbi:bifunctional Ubiquitin specific protease [Babesia duncani]|uniref:Bifunctional Ubiquitin specific protease n=1 Tax=Babesia duncani TaxID=323732 RepID=A0AAD9PJS6_9APIC|nr:bifunctional Ubiquitin specific protease [Babesia duncani]
MEYISNAKTSHDVSLRGIPPVNRNEVELTIENFRENIIKAISRILVNGDQHNELKRLHGITLYSDWKELPNFRFRLMVFPVCPYSEGGTLLSDYKVSVYVEASPKPDWPENWICYGVHFCVFVINTQQPTQTVFKKDSFNFSKTDTDRGWRGIVSHAQITENGFLTPQGDLIVRAAVYPMGAEVDKSSREPCYDSRTVTGFVGLQNHGATCYMNALLQSLYSISKFRRAVYQLDFEDNIGPKSLEICNRLLSRSNKRKSQSKTTEMEFEDSFDMLQQEEYCMLLQEEELFEKKNPSTSLALQNLFYKLCYAPQAPPCKELMQSFGWDSADMFTQQDSHELLKLLLDKIEEQMKGTLVEGSVKQIFEGEMETYIECVNIDYKSVRNETFEDIQLDVQGCNDIYESLDRLVEAELLSGDNMYEAEGHGKQEARKGIRIKRFPPVVVFLLKRFTFDLQRMDTVKLNDRFEFYKEIDLDKYCPGAGVYRLQAISVHVGSINSGHYYAMASTELGQWYRFDDDIVTRVTEYAAIADNFGGSDPDCYNYFDPEAVVPYRRQKVYNAYILIYVKRDQIHELLGPVDPTIENERMIKRCCMQDSIEKIRVNVRERLNQYTKLCIFQPCDYIGQKFMGVPIMGWSCKCKPVTIDRSTAIGKALVHVSNNLDAVDDIDDTDVTEALDHLYIAGFNRQSGFYSLSQLNQRSEHALETLNDLVNLTKYHFYDPTLALFYMQKNAIRGSLIFVKYFDPLPMPTLPTCVDVCLLDLDDSLQSYSKKVGKLLKNAEVASTLDLGDLDYTKLDWYLELPTGYQRLSATTPLASQSVSLGDVLVFNIKPAKYGAILMEYKNTTDEQVKKLSTPTNVVDELEIKCKEITDHFDPFVHVNPEYKKKTGIELASCTDKMQQLFELWDRRSLLELSNNILVSFPIYDFANFVDSRLNEITILFKCYNMMELLGDWRDVSNCPHGVAEAESLSIDEDFDQSAFNETSINVDMRTPCKGVLVHACWKLGIDPANVLMFSCPPNACESIWSKPFGVLDGFVRDDPQFGSTQETLSEGLAHLGINASASVGSEHGTVIHFAVLPIPVSGYLTPSVSGKLRFIGQVFDDTVSITCSCMGLVDVTSTVGELCDLVQHLTNSPKKLRLVSVFGSFNLHGPHVKVVSLPHYTNTTIRNYFAAPMRFEPELIPSNPEQGLLTVLHQTPDGDFFGHPFQVYVDKNWTMAQVKSCIREKLNLPRREWDRWSFFQHDGCNRVWKSNEQTLDWHLSNDLRLLAEHPRPFQKTRSTATMRLC